MEHNEHYFIFRRYFTKEFADIHKVLGLNGIYIASQFITNKTQDARIADVNQTTRISFDKGGEWTHIQAPTYFKNGTRTHCHWVSVGLYYTLQHNH